MGGMDVLLESDLARVEPIPPMLAGVIELAFDLAFESGGAFQRSSSGAGMP